MSKYLLYVINVTHQIWGLKIAIKHIYNSKISNILLSVQRLEKELMKL